MMQGRDTENSDGAILARVTVVERTLTDHLVQCAAANKQLGERLWQVAVIILGVLGSLLVWNLTQGQQIQQTVQSQQANQTAAIIQAIDQIKK